MNTYETLYISPAELPQDKIESTLEKVKAIINRNEGKILSAELWGRRKLSYPIKRQRDGFYVYLLYSAASETPGLLDRHFRVTDSILRGLTVKVDPRHLEKIRAPARVAAPAETAVATPPVPAVETPAAEPAPKSTATTTPQQ